VVIVAAFRAMERNRAGAPQKGALR
jgi:hypothetical protein